MVWEGCGCWVFARVVICRTHSGEIWTEPDPQGLSGLKENLIDTWAHWKYLFFTDFYSRLNFSFLYVDGFTSIHLGLRVKSGDYNWLVIKLKMWLSPKCIFNPEEPNWHMPVKRTCNVNPRALRSAEWGLNTEAEGRLKKQVDWGSAEAAWSICIWCNCSKAGSFEMEYFGKQLGPWVVTPVERISWTVSVPACNLSQ